MDVCSEDVDDEYQREVGAKYREKVGYLRSRWGIDIGNALDISIAMGETSQDEYFNAELSDPDTYLEEMVERFTPVEGAEEYIRDSYPIPITEVVESAGHLVSNIPKNKASDVSVKQVAADELFGALALGYEDPILLENDMQVIQRNLEVIDEVYGTETSIVEEKLPEFVDHKKEMVSRLEVGESLGHIEEDDEEAVNKWLKQIDTLSDIQEYSRENYLFGTFPETFLNVYVRTNWLQSDVFDKSDVLESARDRLEHMEELDTEDIEDEREKSKYYASIRDRGYLISRRIAKGEIEGELDLPMSELVAEGVDGVVERIEPRIEEEDERLRSEFSIRDVE